MILLYTAFSKYLREKQCEEQFLQFLLTLLQIWDISSGCFYGPQCIFTHKHTQNIHDIADNVNKLLRM